MQIVNLIDNLYKTCYPLIMIKRTLEIKIQTLAKKFPVISLNGPRQSGKTTLVQKVFNHLPYISLENLDTRQWAIEDPRRFLNQFPKGAIIDEAQRAPELFSYIQTSVDANKKTGFYVLTGSQNFLLMENISQSLAGRVAICQLLPLSLSEMADAHVSPTSIEDSLFKGFYPGLHQNDISPLDFFSNYTQTYIERDVRLIKNITDLSLFQKFMKLCAGRCGQILNLSSLANDCGITHNTARSWISILETSYIIFLLQPHHENFNKRLIKMPKLYFYDVGLVAHLLGIESFQQLTTHPLTGALFESMIISEITKYRFNLGLRPNFYFWRDSAGNEVDCLIETANGLTPIEIKSGSTINEDFFKGIKYWQGLAKTRSNNGFIIYGGETNYPRTTANIISWKNLGHILNKIFI